ncbi:hypothetical protein M2341_001285 [Sphingobium sp. B7D2B]|uniref:hypothetical protein n=1 Tax=Sphingobium sp. B7D2B TaxID=2940583 RepID=UPI0022248FC8|nr:hypothetical protein [Sphingobium sp. B7D2B]MCW2365838.1 hypothetical protein [Sphingobium sp. B7D2B]
MATDEPNQPSIHAVRYLAGRGAEAIETMQALVNQARDLLAGGTLTEADVTAYPWELDRSPPSDGRSHIWAASMHDYATGDGLTTTLYVALATNESAFRRQLACEFDREVANTARVMMGLEQLEKLEPSVAALAPMLLRERLLALDRCEDRPAVFSFLARTHANYA